VAKLASHFLLATGFTKVYNLKPFQVDVWVALIVSVLVSTILIVQLVNGLRLKCGWHDLVPVGNSEFTFTLPAFFTLFALLMDTEVYMGGVAKSKRFRWFIFAWLFGSLILRTAYRGGNISTVIVPPVSMNILTSFAQLRGFSLYTKASSTGRLQSRTEASLGTSVKSRAGMAFQKYLAWKYGLNVKRTQNY
jgi:hypothetical protein